MFLFDTKIIKESIKVDGTEILDVKWYTYEEILNMKVKDELRADGYFLSAIRNKMNTKIQTLDIIKTK